MATHYIFKGDEVIARTRIYAGEHVPGGGDGYGFDVWIEREALLTVEDVDRDGFIIVRQALGLDGDLVDIEAGVGPGEINHDHNLCEDVLDNLDYEYDTILGHLLATWED